VYCSDRRGQHTTPPGVSEHTAADRDHVYDHDYDELMSSDYNKYDDGCVDDLRLVVHFSYI